jgi:hypothetical protein
MKDDELIKILEKNPEYQWQNGVAAALTAIITILIEKGITTTDDFNKRVEESQKYNRKYQLSKLDKEEREFLENLAEGKFDITGLFNSL